VGKINIETIEFLQFEESNFIVFEEKYHPPIFKEDIQDFIIYKVEKKKFINYNIIRLNKVLRSRASVNIS